MKKTLSKGNCLKGFKVNVEVELKSGARASKQTSLYWGIYVGIVRMNKMDMLVLKHARHYNLAEVIIKSEEEDSGSRMVESKLCFIDMEKIISIDLTDDKFNLDEVNIEGSLI